MGARDCYERYKREYERELEIGNYEELKEIEEYSDFEAEWWEHNRDD